MTIELSVNDLLACVHQEKWGFRRVETVRLVAQLSIPGYWTEIGRDLLSAALDRQPRQGQYDHEVMVELADARFRVLARRRGTGRQPDVWKLNCVCKWRNVPFAFPRKRLVSLFCYCSDTNAVALMYKSAAPRLPLTPGEPPKSGVSGHWLSANHLVTTPRHLVTTPRDEREPDAPPGLYGTDSGPSSQLHEVSIDTSSSSSNQEEEEEAQRASEKLAAAVADAIGKPALFGAPLHRVHELIAAYPDRLAELVALAPRLAGVLSPERAVAVLGMMAQSQASAGWRPEPCEVITDRDGLVLNLRRRIATYREQGLGDEVNELEEQLSQLEGQVR